MRNALTFGALLFLCGASAARAQGNDPLKAKADEAKALLAQGKHKEAAALLEPLLRDASFAKSTSRDTLLYYLGCASAGLGDDIAAGRALARLAPFAQPAIGPHARYLLGRIHHRASEATEALEHYEAVAGAKIDAPYAAEAVFYSAVLLYEQKRFADAQQRFGLFLQRDKRPEWVDEARLRLGMCHVRLNQAPEAVKVLQPLQDHARHARQARWWIARAILSAPGGKPGDAAEHLKKAAAAPESDPGPSQPELLLTLGDALDRAGRPAEAVPVYQQLASGPRAEEALARLAGAQAAAKMYREADETAARFEKQYPGSAFLGDVLLRRADVAFAEAQAEPKPERWAEAVTRYERVLAGASGATAHAARYRIAIAQYRGGRFADAAASLRAIPDGDRMGELAGASYLLAECLLRGAPPADQAADALSAARLLKEMQEAADHLQKALATTPSPEVMMKLGHALKEIAQLLGNPPERAQAAHRGRELFEHFRATFPNHALRSVAEYERANCYALAGDPATAIQKLERFKGAPFVNTPVAPLALLRQAQLYRATGQPAAAVTVLNDCRTRYEQALLKDSVRKSWVPLLRYHHGAALKEAKQAAEAAKILESVVKEHAGSEWAEPSSRLLKELKP